MDYSLNWQERLVLLIKPIMIIPLFLLIFILAFTFHPKFPFLGNLIIFAMVFVWIVWPFLVWKSLQNIMHPLDNKFTNVVGYILFISSLVLTVPIDGLNYQTPENPINNMYVPIVSIIQTCSFIALIICTFIIWGKATATLTSAEIELSFPPTEKHLTFIGFFAGHIGIFFLSQRIEMVLYQLKRNQKLEEEKSKSSEHPQ